MSKKFAICIRNDGYEASLEVRKVYDVLADDDASRRGLIRVIDESGTDYLFPMDFFVPLELPSPQGQKLSALN